MIQLRHFIKHITRVSADARSAQRPTIFKQRNDVQPYERGTRSVPILLTLVNQFCEFAINVKK